MGKPRHYADPKPGKPSMDYKAFCGARIEPKDYEDLKAQLTSDPNKTDCPKCLARINRNEHLQ